MIRIASIVEGDGEVAALPILLRRICVWKTPQRATTVIPPVRVRRDRFLNKDEEFERQLQLCAAKCGDGDWILILLDADDDCPARLGAQILARACRIVPHRKISVVLANKEFEAWFIAAAHSLNGLRGFSIKPDEPIEPENHRNAKGWMDRRMQGAYKEILDQPAFAATFDLEAAFSNSRSFRKLCKELETRLSS